MKDAGARLLLEQRGHEGMTAAGSLEAGGQSQWMQEHATCAAEQAVSILRDAEQGWCFSVWS